MYNSIALSHPAPQRLLIEYIVHFNHVWQLFDVMDSSHDHRLSGGAPPFCPFACCLEKRSLRETLATFTHCCTCGFVADAAEEFADGCEMVRGP